MHTIFDGDTIFALATGASGIGGNPTVIGMLAAAATTAAVLNAVRAAVAVAGPGVPPLPALRDLLRAHRVRDD